jgi:hypothetical protein
MAVCQEGFIECHGTRGLNCNEPIDCGSDLLKPSYKHEALTVGNECSWAEGALDQLLDWICLVEWLRVHPPLASLDRYQFATIHSNCRADRPQKARKRWRIRRLIAQLNFEPIETKIGSTPEEEIAVNA